jgi:hypothetical protein
VPVAAMSAIAAVTKQIRITTAMTILCRRYPRSHLIVATGRNMRIEFDGSVWNPYPV